MLKLKLAFTAVFLAFGVITFINFGNPTKAQTDNILTDINNYKTWKQVQKPEVKKETEIVTTDVVAISDSTVAG